MGISLCRVGHIVSAVDTENYEDYNGVTYGCHFVDWDFTKQGALKPPGSSGIREAALVIGIV